MKTNTVLKFYIKLIFIIKTTMTTIR